MYEISSVQADLLIMGLELEINTNLRMQMTKESSLHAFKRLTGINPGRGIKGRENAIAILKNALAGVA
jgi:hypothetical protein